jgi:YesN/AraC family two-component response regulator
VIIAVAERASHDLYRSLPLKGKRVEVCTPAQALDRVREPHVELVLFDCSNNAQRGLEDLKELKALRPDVPVVFIAEEASFEVAARAVRAGARDLMAKPMSLRELKTVVEKLSGIRSSGQEKRRMIDLAQANDMVLENITVTSDMPPFVLRVIGFIEDHLAEKITLQDLADQAYLSKYHFCRLFSRHVGMSPMRLIASLRVERAKRLLRNGDSGTKSVCREAGFGDAATFARTFKKVTGMTPEEYKRKVRRCPDGSPMGRSACGPGGGRDGARGPAVKPFDGKNSKYRNKRRQKSNFLA